MMRYVHFIVLLLLAACTESEDQAGDPPSPYVAETGAPLPVRPQRVPLVVTEVHPDSVVAARARPVSGRPRVIPGPENVRAAGLPRITEITVPPVVIRPGTEGVPPPRVVTAHATVRPAIQRRPEPTPAPGLTRNATGHFQFLDAGSLMNGGRIYAIVQDRSGNIWFGQDGGISKYDGNHITNYTTEQGLGVTWVRSMFVDEAGNLWIGGEPGISKFDGRTFTNFATAENIGDNLVLTLTGDRHGNVWAGTREGIRRLTPARDGKEATFTHFTIRQGLSDNNIKSVLEDRRGNLWFGTLNGGVIKYDPDRSAAAPYGSLTRYSTAQGLVNNHVLSIHEDRNGRLWFGSGGGGPSFDVNFSGDESGGVDCLYPSRDGHGDTLAHYGRSQGLEGQVITDIHEDRTGNLWFATADAGVSKLHDADGDAPTFTSFTTRQGLSNNDITSIHEDGQGNLWFGSGTNGAIRYKPGIQYFTRDNGFTAGNAYMIQGDRKGNVWIATNGAGVFHYDGRDFTQFTEREGLAGDAVFAAAEDAEGNLWFGTNGGLSRLDPEAYRGRGAFTTYTTHQGLRGDVQFSLHRDDNNALWMGGIGIGITRLLPGEHAGKPRITHYTIPSDPTGTPSDPQYRAWVNAVVDDRRGTLWFNARHVGLFSVDTTGEQMVADHYRGLIDTATESHRVFAITPDRAGSLWLGTQQGLRYYDGADFYPFPLNDQLGAPLSVVPDGRGNIWLGRHQGLTLLAPASPAKSESSAPVPGTVYRNTPYAKNDGLLHLNFWRGAYLDRKHRLWFGTGESLTRLDLNEFPLPSGSPQISLNSVDINQHFIDYHRLSDTTYLRSLPFGKRLARSVGPIAASANYPRNLSLPSRLNHLNFRFSAIDWSAPHKIQYSYRMEGLDESWSIPSPSSTAEYRNLPYGTFTLKVRAIGEGSAWSDPLAYTFTILPPWYHTWWARLGYGLAGAFLLFRFVRWRTGRHKRRLRIRERELAQERLMTDRLREIDKLKDQFLANTSHELRTPLHGIIGLSESLYETAGTVSAEKQRVDLGMIISSGKRLNHLINDILDFSKLKNSDLTLQQKPLNLRIICDIVFHNNAPLMGGKTLQLCNDIPPNLPAALADENRMQQIFYNLVGNAMKFTERGHIRVGAVLVDDLIRVEVEDTGVGIPKEKHQFLFTEFSQLDGAANREFSGTGLGLSISKQLVELHGGTMWVESEVNRGSTFYFTVPTAGDAVATGPAASPPVAASVPAPQPSAVLPAEGRPGDVRILVVDDEPINQQVMCNHLSHQGFHLTQAMNGEEAIRTIEEHEPFDLVLLDVMMPRMSGYEVCQKLRQTYLSSELPIIMVTAKNQLKNVVQGLALGANDYLPKPFHKQELLARINTQLDLHRIFKVAGKFVPNAFLHSLNRNRLTEVVLGDHIEREVTVLFTDIRDYTTLSEAMTPEETFMFVNDFNGRIGPVVQQHHGFVNQYLGDGIMAIFPRHCRDALDTAIAIQTAIHKRNGGLPSDGQTPLRVGTGLHSGPLIMGITGDKDRMDATTIADTVNTASRIESLTKYYGASILLSQDSLDRIGDTAAYHLRYLGKVVVKGKRDPIGLYECFNGDPPRLLEKKLVAQEVFERGLAHFYDRDFAAAVAAFDQVLKITPDDQPARLFLHRASKLLVRGTDQGWTGVEVMTFK
ncbi:two-component regulator propeller domain-containing protein [Lewinella sp. JB7]|uniref:two-component regulator propeller domain-containing protein n=1 Tax=Lewinella sp. JB7 TaxID=2962887 RepID=UPI0020CA1383|nr:two-component regulator propeller domain-containing protein [Lewinella sp. JB7]MCP9234613.1 ATP-binding protein [Lewinella sp. JB7]